MEPELLRHNDFKRASVLYHTNTDTLRRKSRAHTVILTRWWLLCHSEGRLPSERRVITLALATPPQTTDALDADVWFLWLPRLFFTETPGITHRCHYLLPEIRSFRISHYADNWQPEPLLISFFAFFFPRKPQHRCANTNLYNTTWQKRGGYLLKAAAQERYEELSYTNHAVKL